MVLLGTTRDFLVWHPAVLCEGRGRGDEAQSNHKEEGSCDYLRSSSGLCPRLPWPASCWSLVEVQRPGAQEPGLGPDPEVPRIFGEFGTLDPGEFSSEVDQEIAQNFFNGLTRFDNSLAIQPTSPPTSRLASNGGISEDGAWKPTPFHLQGTGPAPSPMATRSTSKGVRYSRGTGQLSLRASARDQPGRDHRVQAAVAPRENQASGRKSKKPGSTATDAEKEAFADAGKRPGLKVEQIAASDKPFQMTA